MTIEQRLDSPPHFTAYPDKLGAWTASMVSFDLRYGSHDFRPRHTGAHFGFVRLGICDAWVWADVLLRYPSRATLREARRAFFALCSERPWTLWARCATAREKRFAEFFGFEHVGFEEADYLMRREPWASRQ